VDEVWRGIKGHLLEKAIDLFGSESFGHVEASFLQDSWLFFQCGVLPQWRKVMGARTAITFWTRETARMKILEYPARDDITTRCADDLKASDCFPNLARVGNIRFFGRGLEPRLQRHVNFHNNGGVRRYGDWLKMILQTVSKGFSLFSLRAIALLCDQERRSGNPHHPFGHP
jgi:hypothetical protein